MAAQSKPKPVAKKSTNDDRHNRKAWKSGLPPAKRDHRKSRRGSRPLDHKFTEVEKVLLGGGMLRDAHRRHAKDD